MGAAGNLAGALLGRRDAVLVVPATPARSSPPSCASTCRATQAAPRTRCRAKRAGSRTRPAGTRPALRCPAEGRRARELPAVESAHAARWLPAPLRLEERLRLFPRWEWVQLPPRLLP
eukprot:512782-Rhodomonas_salina.1